MNQTQTPPVSLINAFRRACEPRPDAVAVVDNDRSLTFKQFEEATLNLSHELRTGYGVEPGDRVAIQVERSVELIVALVAVVFAGAVYVPLDESEPTARLLDRLEDCGARVFITDTSAQEDWIPESVAVVGPRLRQTAAADRREPPEVQGDALACLMYTSGSTGTPKAVMVEHRNICNLVTNCSYVSIGPQDRVLHLAPVAFDAATFEIWGALLNGAVLVLAPPGPVDTDELREILQRHAVSVVWLTAALFHRQISADPESLGLPRTVIAGGDVMSPPHVRRLLSAVPDCHLVNAYGPTETTTFATYHRVVDSDLSGPIPIGAPIQNVEVRVVSDESGREAYPGSCGELWIGGAGVARGYWQNPTLTSEVFVHSEDSGERFYRTGDLGVRRPDGSIEFRGRRDNQIKLRGFRIEPAEVEAALSRSPQVTEAAAGIRQNHRDEATLVAWIQPSSEQVHRRSLRAQLRSLLPEYLIPTAIVEVTSLPLTVGGKIDRLSLPEPQWEQRDAYV